MQIRTFEAANLGAAHAAVRDQLGVDALILATEPTRDGVRVTAAVEPQDDLAELLRAAESAPDPRLGAVMAFHGVPAGLRAMLARDVGGEPLETALTYALKPRLRPAPVAARRLFLGPPGHGKTLQTARLARRLAAAGQPPTVVAVATPDDPVDGRLQAWLAPCGIAVQTADGLADLDALAGTPGALLVDAPGLSPATSRGAARLRALIDAARDTTPTLVLSIEAGASDLLETASNFLTLGCRAVLPTKLDLARRYGGLLALACGGVAMMPASVSDRVDEPPAPLHATGLAKLLIRRFDSHAPHPHAAPAQLEEAPA